MQDQIYIVGVGASAGGLEALTELFSNLPLPIRKHCAFIVAQHLSPHYKSMLVQILSKESNLPVIEAKNHMAIELGQIYITPPDYDVKVGGGLLVLTKPSNPTGPKPSVDVLFSSLANEYKSKALGIILSGTGSDGAAGLEAIKSQGGFAIIQNPENSKYDGMPVASLQTGVVDFSLPAKKIGEKLEELLFHEDALIVTAQDDGLLSQLHTLVYEKYGTNFENYKDSTILRRIDKCAKNAGVKTLEEYLRLVSTNALELQNLYDSFLINVTSFFRDPDSFIRLEKEIEERIKKYTLEKDFRVWIPGCSTGQEAYSMAMIIQRQLDLSGRQNCILQIFATDLDEDALSVARKGVYSAEEIAAIPVAYQHEYLVETSQGYEFSKNIRSRILFSKHDVTINPPFLKLDMVSCRNLLIYLNSHLQRKIFPVFHYAMKENGLLFLGKSESVHVVDDLYDVVDGHFKIFRKRKFGSISQSVRFSNFRPLTVKTEWERKAAQYTVTDYHARLHETFVGLSGHAYFCS
ncbi:MAG: chemotaxis protein CheB [Flavobacteriales bacterium]